MEAREERLEVGREKLEGSGNQKKKRTRRGEERGSVLEARGKKKWFVVRKRGVLEGKEKKSVERGNGRNVATYP